MLREIAIGGALAPSPVLYVLVAIPLYLIIDRFASAIGFYRLVWNPALVRVGLFVCLLSGFVLLTKPGGMLP
jgi:hypothetical protein